MKGYKLVGGVPIIESKSCISNERTNMKFTAFRVLYNSTVTVKV